MQKSIWAAYTRCSAKLSSVTDSSSSGFLNLVKKEFYKETLKYNLGAYLLGFVSLLLPFIILNNKDGALFSSANATSNISIM